MEHDELRTPLKIVTTDELTRWEKFGPEIITCTILGTILAICIKLLACLPWLYRPQILEFLGLSDTKFPFILDLLGLHFGHASFFPHWILVGSSSVLITECRRFGFRRRYRDPERCSDAFLERVAQAREKIPPAIQNLLVRHGYKIVAARQLLTAVRSIYPAPFDSFTGYCFTLLRLIIVCEYCKPKESWIPGNNPCSVLAHEVGHAVDNCLMGVSNQSRFRLAHKKDCGRLNETEKSRLAYYIQRMSRQGRGEAFSEIFASILGQSLCPEIEQHFPECAKVVRGVLEARFKASSWL